MLFYDRWLDKATIRSDGDLGKNGSETPNPWRLSTVTRVEELKMMIRLLPIWATTIIFWCVHAQVITFSVQQAASMDRSIGKFHVPAASFAVFFIGATMITLALYDRMVMKKSRGSRGKFMQIKIIECPQPVMITNIILPPLLSHPFTLL